MTRGLYLSDPGPLAKWNPWDTSKWPAPLHACWARDPLWTNPGDGGAVSAWRNHSGGGDPAQGTAAAKPTYRVSTSAFAGQPTVQFDGGDELLIDTTDIAQPYKLIVIGSITDTGNARAFMGTSGGSNRMGKTSGNLWSIAAGTTLAAAGGSSTNPVVMQGTFNGASSEIIVNGTSVGTGNAGAGAHINFALGAASAASTRLLGHLHYAAVYDGGISNADLLEFMRAGGRNCGITVA